MSDGGWLNAPAGLLRKEGSNTPVYDELLKLVKGEWWTGPSRLMTDKDGKLTFDGFPGDYELTYEGKQAFFELPKEIGPRIEVRL